MEGALLRAGRQRRSRPIRMHYHNDGPRLVIIFCILLDVDIGRLRAWCRNFVAFLAE